MAFILVIDDDKQIQAYLREVLEFFGYEVVVASDGMEGLKLFRDKPADLVITDIIMPEKTGFEIIMDLKREFPAVKVIAISGGDKVGPGRYLEVAESFGADRILLKPFKHKELLEDIQELLGDGNN